MSKFLVIFFLGLGLLIRLWYFVYPFGRSAEITVDEAVYGIQAIKITLGERPVFYPAQDYTGSFSAYLSAFLFSLGAVSVFALKVVPFVFSLGTIYLNYLLALRVFGKQAAFLALFFTSLGTPFWNNWSSRAGSGYVEATFLGILLLLLTLRIIENVPRRNFYFFLFGFLSGLGFWIQPTIVYFVLPSLIYLVFNLKGKILFLPIIFLLVGFLFGAWPVFYYNLFVKTAATGSALFKRPWGIKGAAAKLIFEGLPVLLGGRTANSRLDFHHPTSVSVYLLFTFSFLYFLRKVFFPLKVSQPGFLLFLTFFSTVGIFLLSTPFNQLSIEPRYVFSLYAVIPLILGNFLAHLFRLRGFWWLVALGLYLFNFSLGLARAGPLTFLDAYSFRNLVGFLQQEKIDYVIATSSLGHRIMFFSGGKIKAAVRGGGLTEARFESLNYEVTKVRDSDARLVAFVSHPNDPEAAGFGLEVGENSRRLLIDNQFLVFYSKP